MTGMKESIGVGILGFGNVGGALVGLISDHAKMICARNGVELRVERVAVRNVSKDRGTVLPDGVLTADAAAVVDDPAVDVVVEVIGGIEPARSLILAALQQGKPVVTANKELLANVGDRALRGRGARRGRPALRGIGRGRHPAHPPAARVARRREDPPGHRNRQRHDQLHPHAA